MGFRARTHNIRICVSNLWFELVNVYFDEVSKFRKVKYLIATFAFGIPIKNV